MLFLHQDTKVRALKPGIAAHAPSSQAEAAGRQVQGLLELYSETLPQNQIAQMIFHMLKALGPEVQAPVLQRK